MTLRSISFTVETVLISRLTTLSRAVGNNEGFEVKVIDIEQEVGDGKSKEAKGNELEEDKL